MIDISLWRAVIGSWIFKGPLKEKGTNCDTDQMIDETMMMSYSYLYSMYIMYYVLLVPYRFATFMQWRR